MPSLRCKQGRNPDILMEGNKRIILVNPRARATDERLFAWARRTDKAGTRKVMEDSVIAGNWTTMFTIRESEAWKDIDENWMIIDERKVKFTIDRVAEVEGPSALGRKLNLLARRKDPRSGT